MRGRRKKTLRLLIQSFRITGILKFFSAYIIFFFVAAFILLNVEPQISTYFDSLWYCFAVSTTIGFGDITAVSAIGRVLTVILSLYSIVVTAIVTAATTSFFLDLAKLRANESAQEFLDDLEHLSELSPEELDRLSEKVKHFRRTGAAGDTDKQNTNRN